MFAFLSKASALIAIMATIAAATAGCIDPAVAIQPWDAQTATSASVGNVEIVNRSGNATVEALQQLRRALEQKTAACAQGPKKYEMLVRLDSFNVGNPVVAAVFVRDVHEISAEVRMIDLTTRKIVASYYIQVTTGGSGLLAAATMAGGPRAISDEFAANACSKIFGK